ncbi:hypothetical protein MLD38_005744 [Melastoma candidum]|uniref:Uncharacterized protein n=1 Tax=Melastoma candidum TaxID=119954 RepID=A0ACB9RU35_9MYRT|nr:hypothetical protein MLD38_005744 [Melastoma candidum]
MSLPPSTVEKPLKPEERRRFNSKGRKRQKAETQQFFPSPSPIQSCDIKPFLAVPLVAMEGGTKYTRGTKVEVLNMNDLPFGSWRCGEIVSRDGHNIMVRYYSSNSATTGDMLERVSFQLIRPYPPLLDISRAWAPGELVEIFNNFTWRMGTVSRALGRNYFVVQLLGFSEVLRASSSDIRARRSWQDDRWTLIGPGSSSLDVTNSIRRREIIEVEGYDVSGERSRVSARRDLKRSLMIIIPKHPEIGSPYADSRSAQEQHRTIVIIPPARPSLEDDDCRSIQSSTSSCSININGLCHEPPSCEILSARSSDAESYCYRSSRQGNEEVDAEVRRMELHAYHSMMEALGASGTLTWEQESLVTNLRMLLNISNDEHLSKLRQLVQLNRQMRVSRSVV